MPETIQQPEGGAAVRSSDLLAAGRIYYQDDFVTLWHGDALDLLASGQISGVDATVIDPPYCSGGRQQTSARSVFRKNRGEESPDWFIGDNMGSDSYLWWMREITKRIFNLVPVGSHLYCFTDWRQYSHTCTALETVGWSLRNCIVWDKGNIGMGFFWRNTYELVQAYSKGPPRALPHKSFSNLIRARKPDSDIHPTVKPTEILTRLIEASSATCVLDCFAGSGSTLVAAKRMRVKSIGIEKNEHFCELAAKRCAEDMAMGEAANDKLSHEEGGKEQL